MKCPPCETKELGPGKFSSLKKRVSTAIMALFFYPNLTSSSLIYLVRENIVFLFMPMILLIS
jgi:hypothetical protein